MGIGDPALRHYYIQYSFIMTTTTTTTTIFIQQAILQVDPSVAEQSAKAKVSEFAFDCAMDSTDPKAYNYVSQDLGNPMGFFGIFLMIQGERHFRIDEFLQDKCYQLMAKRMVDHVLSGYFSCLFCYGQTGTGKTTTIMGKAGHMVGCGGVNKMLSPSSFQTPCLRKIEVLFKCGKHIRQFPANFPLPPTRKASLEPRFQSLTAFQNTNVLPLVAIKFGRRIGNHLSFQGD